MRSLDLRKEADPSRVVENEGESHHRPGNGYLRPDERESKEDRQDEARALANPFNGGEKARSLGRAVLLEVQGREGQIGQVRQKHSGSDQETRGVEYIWSVLSED